MPIWSGIQPIQEQCLLILGGKMNLLMSLPFLPIRRKQKFDLNFKTENNSGASGNYGWLIDDIKVTAAPSELNPPVVTLNAPVLLGGVSNTGPFTISADITDASGIGHGNGYLFF